MELVVGVGENSEELSKKSSKRRHSLHNLSRAIGSNEEKKEVVPENVSSNNSSHEKDKKSKRKSIKSKIKKTFSSEDESKQLLESSSTNVNESESLVILQQMPKIPTNSSSRRNSFSSLSRNHDTFDTGSNSGTPRSNTLDLVAKQSIKMDEMSKSIAAVTGKLTQLELNIIKQNKEKEIRKLKKASNSHCCCSFF